MRDKSADHAGSSAIGNGSFSRARRALGMVKRAILRAWRAATTQRTGTVLLYKYQSSKVLGPQSGCVVREITPETVSDALSMESDSMVGQFRTFLYQGHRGFFAYRDGLVVHRSWCVIGPATVTTWFEYAPLTLPASAAYLHYCATAPSCRGLGVYPMVLSQIVSVLASEGIEDVYVATDVDNVASQRGIVKAGFTLISKTGVTVIAGVPRYRRESFAPIDGEA